MQDSKPNPPQKEATQTDQFAAALRGEASLSVGDVIQRSWDITLRALPMMLFAFVVVMVVNGFVSVLAAQLFPVSEEQPSLTNTAAQSFLSMLLVAPFSAVVTLMGLKNARDAKPGLSTFAEALRHAPQVLAITFILSFIVMALSGLYFAILGESAVAFALMLATALYFQFAFLLAIPLVLERGLSVSRAIIASFIVVNKKMFVVLGIYIILFIIVFISALPLFLGLLFTFPMTFNVIGVIYNRLIGVPESESKTTDVTEGDHS
ncbi:hypothetical protein [Pseudidiomarina insulisalsae]|uniref:Stress protein n=1 Tax=Pseudidiomarina insulisalsae TaxID=575789 RepID=A0A432YHA4_9GAMM|nr:hypothetical protein [Pseudidiomarina insulisalsae]RUO60326.1 hypothetical protein CWI71_07945 [Pseudidiomarina insulisalsae]